MAKHKTEQHLASKAVIPTGHCFDWALHLLRDNGNDLQDAGLTRLVSSTASTLRNCFLISPPLKRPIT